MSNAETYFGPALGLGNAILSKQKLDKALRELIILAVARLEGGIYEWVQHVPIGERAGCTKEQIAALEALQFDDPAFDARAKAMLRLVHEVVREVKAGEAAVAGRQRAFLAAGDRGDHPDLRFLHDDGAADRNHPRRCRCSARSRNPEVDKGRLAGPADRNAAGKIMLTIVPTIDTEGFHGPQPFEQFILGEVSGSREEWGVFRIFDICRRNGVSATFFVDVYESIFWGEDKFRNLARGLLDAGADVQLHTHPEFRGPRSEAVARARVRTDIGCSAGKTRATVFAARWHSFRSSISWHS